MMGFDYVCEVAHGAELVSRAIMETTDGAGTCPRPLISSSLPGGGAADPDALSGIDRQHRGRQKPHGGGRRSRRAAGFCAERGVADKDVGCFFITPCAAKITAIRNPLGHTTSAA